MIKISYPDLNCSVEDWRCCVGWLEAHLAASELAADADDVAAGGDASASANASLFLLASSNLSHVRIEFH